MPHAWNFEQLRSRDICRRIAAGLDRHEWIVRAVNDNRRRLDPFERRATIALHQRGDHLPGKARRIIRNATSVFERNQMKIIAEPRKSLVLAV